MGYSSDTFGLSFEQAARSAAEQYPQIEIFSQLNNAFQQGDMAPVAATLEDLSHEYPAVVIAQVYFSIFCAVDNSVFARFAEAAVVYVLTEKARGAKAMTEAEQNYLGTTYLAYLKIDKDQSLGAYLKTATVSVPISPKTASAIPWQNLPSFALESGASTSVLPKLVREQALLVFGTDAEEKLRTAATDLGLAFAAIKCAR